MKPTARVAPIPPETSVGDDVTYKLVTRSRDGVETTHYPTDTRIAPWVFARSIAQTLGIPRTAVPEWLEFICANGRWTAVDTRRCKACGQIKGLPMCCDDPETVREMMLLGTDAPIVIRQPKVTVGGAA